MNNFEYHIPTRIIFGRNTHKKVGEVVKEYGFQKILVHYGGESAKRSGLLDQVTDSLEQEGIDFILLGGVQPNPTLSLARKGMEICRENQVDFILAVGGGSVLDSAKCIADGLANPEIDIWKCFLKEAVPERGFPMGSILTLSASGSELSQSCVITNEEEGLKRGFNSVTHRPLFSICNPELTFSVNKFQTGCGTVDILMHTLERYLGGDTPNTDITDRLAEGVLKSVIDAGIIADCSPQDYEARAALMWAGSLSHNDLTGLGRDFVMQVHQLEHELSGKFPEVAHGAGLSALFCSWARYVCDAAPERFAQLAVRVWNVEVDFTNPMKTALEGISRTEAYFKRIGMPVSLKELGVEISDDDMEDMAEKCTFFGKRVLPGIKTLKKEDMKAVYKMALLPAAASF